PYVTLNISFEIYAPTPLSVSLLRLFLFYCGSANVWCSECRSVTTGPEHLASNAVEPAHNWVHVHKHLSRPDIHQPRQHRNASRQNQPPVHCRKRWRDKPHHEPRRPESNHFHGSQRQGRSSK